MVMSRKDELLARIYERSPPASIDTELANSILTLEDVYDPLLDMIYVQRGAVLIFMDGRMQVLSEKMIPMIVQELRYRLRDVLPRNLHAQISTFTMLDYLNEKLSNAEL